jgi:hypothetical protein
MPLTDLTTMYCTLLFCWLQFFKEKNVHLVH